MPLPSWSHNVYNLIRQRHRLSSDATMEWVDGSLGSRLTMKYPAVWLMEPGARAAILSVALRRQRPASGYSQDSPTHRTTHQRCVGDQ